MLLMIPSSLKTVAVAAVAAVMVDWGLGIRGHDATSFPCMPMHNNIMGELGSGVNGHRLLWLARMMGRWGDESSSLIAPVAPKGNHIGQI